MKRKLLFLSGILCSPFLFSQTSDFLTFSKVTTSQLVPYTEPVAEKSVVKVKPNFKGKELKEVNVNPTHYPDWAWQQHASQEKATTATLLWSVNGLSAQVSPLDESGDVDSLYYLGAINGSSGAVYKIFNKSTGAQATGTAASYTMDALGGAGGLGDPIVLYYKPARRWILTEFAASSNSLLVHVSQTSSPTGAYYTHTFSCPSFPDYPKYAIWANQDAMIVSTNENTSRVYAMKLSTLIAGTSTPFFGTNISGLNGFGFQSITPVDLEGDTPASASQKPIFMRHRDDESHNSSPNASNDYLEVWEMTINWTNNSCTVAKTQDIAITEFDSDLCGLTSFSCIPQPGTNTKLDPLREPCMYKVPYRIFSDHEAIICAFATDVSGSNRAGIRWVELRRTGSTGAWSKYQEGTYSPGTTTNRWMPSINIDKNGNIVMAYSTSSSSTGDFPSLKFTGRKACDPLGQMTITETTIVSGTSSKSGDTRWGDYHHMSMDPFTDDIFYFTGGYYSGGDKARVCAIKVNPDAIDATVNSAFQTIPGTICGSSAQIGVIIENKGTTTMTSGSFQWQVGTGNSTTVNYTTNIGTGLTDTIFVTITGLVNGANTVTISQASVNSSTPDDNTCNDAYTLTLTTGSNGGFTSSGTTTVAPSCSPGADGTITLTATGGSAPFTYSINGGASQSSNTFYNVSQGTLTYTITDNTGCSSSGTIMVDANTTLSANSSISQAILCYGNTATVTVTASGGTSTYTYSSDGTTYNSSNSFNNLSAGSYTFYIKDANGCIKTSSQTITQPAALGINAVPTAITCNGANDGQISIQGSGGTSPYTYSTDGTNFSSSTTQGSLAPDTYTVTIKDANNCTTTTTTTVVEPTALSVSGVSTSSTAANNGTITLNGTGGTSPYTYSINGTSYVTSSLFTGLAAGTYTCYIKDSKGCISTTTVTISVNTAGIEETSDMNIVGIYPNPTNGELTIELTGVTSTNVTLKFFNTMGELVAQKDLFALNGSVKETIELSKKLAPGHYFLGIYDASKTPIITKIIKQ